MVASTPEAFATAVTAYRFGDVSLDSALDALEDDDLDSFGNALESFDLLDSPT